MLIRTPTALQRWAKALKTRAYQECQALWQSTLARAFFITWAILLAASAIAAQVTTYYADAITHARVEAYSAGRAAAIADFAETNSAAVAETCVAWLDGRHDHKAAVLDMCRYANN